MHRDMVQEDSVFCTTGTTVSDWPQYPKVIFRSGMPSAAVASGVLDIKIQAASVNTDSGMKDGKLKSKDFFNAEQDPYITFHSRKIVETGPNTVDIPGKFTIRGVTKDETLHLIG
jgi:polyisoprenoid-binding protein YceI